MPGYSLTLAVLIGCEPYSLCALGGFLKFGYKCFLVSRNLIFRLEVRVHADADVLFAQVTYVAEARHHFIIFTKEFFYGLGLRRRLDYYEILHIQFWMCIMADRIRPTLISVGKVSENS